MHAFLDLAYLGRAYGRVLSLIRIGDKGQATSYSPSALCVNGNRLA